MTDVERMYRHLVRTIRASFPQYLTQPFQVGELYQTILPYRLHRRELGLETNQDYEHTLLELLSGANGYLVIDDRMRDQLTAERATSAPDTARIRDFGNEHVALAPEALQRLDSPTPAAGSSGHTISRGAIPTPIRGGTPSSTGTPASVTEPRGSASVSSAPRRATRPMTVPEDGENCAFCKGALPPGREIAFCPHCGQDLTVSHCPACGSELERGWKFCVTCGRSAGGS
ncbi:MAG: zinc ribbon domain-containing protein [Gemmatimonadota bacterium]